MSATTALQHLTDDQLVNYYQNKLDPAAIDILYRRYYQRVLTYCHYITGDREEAQDVAADVFVKMTENLHRLRAVVTFQAWLFRIAHNHAISTCKRRRKIRWSGSSQQLEALIDTGSGTQDGEEREMEIVKMQAAVAALPLEMQALLHAKYTHGASIENLMAQYHLSESAVKMRLARARRKANKYFVRA